MKLIAQMISWIALGATALPSMIYFGGGMELPTVKTVMLIAAAVWFASAPFWMEHRTE